jgi:transcriptional regulator with PAS, ATPase and Fis domain
LTASSVALPEIGRRYRENQTAKPSLEMVLRRIHPDDREFVQQTIEWASEARADFDFEHRLLMPDGLVKHLHVSARVLATSSGNLEFVGAVTDVTAAKQAEEKSRQDAYELRSITDSIPQAIVVYNSDGQAIYVNRVGLEYTGLSIEEMRAESFRDRVVHPKTLRGSEICGKMRSYVAPLLNTNCVLSKKMASIVGISVSTSAERRTRPDYPLVLDRNRHRESQAGSAAPPKRERCVARRN